MKLKPVQTYADVSLKGRVPGDLHAPLTAYASYYHETIGHRSRSDPSSCRCSSGSSRRTASSRRGSAGRRTGLDRDR
jgi:hypothetical protein